MDLLQLILLAMVALTLIISFFTWITQQSEHRIGRIKFDKEWAKDRLITIKTELEEIASKPEGYEGRLLARVGQDKLWWRSPILYELSDIGYVLGHMGLLVPRTLIYTILEKDFFENTAKLQKAINQIETLLRELS